MSHPYHVFDAQDSFRFNATRDIVGSSPPPMYGSQAEHLASPLHYLHGHPLVPYLPDPCYAYYEYSVTIPTNRIESTMEPITTLENHDGDMVVGDPSASLQAFASEGNVAIPKTMMITYHVKPYNVRLSSVQSDHEELVVGDANADLRTSQAGPSSFPTTVNNFVTYGPSTTQEHVILPYTPLGKKDPEAYIATFTKDG
ncbi:hypothetical protein M422DRAFT_243644 [Sphaerobolus stellatus SS14]|nr:hypothetical protein M422DRAFT_243644 [Sphaerobolus stellatus SS14]